MSEKENVAAYYFHQGTDSYAYKYMGAHLSEDGGSWVFRTWAPNALSVQVVGDFTSWRRGMFLDRITPEGIWEGRIPASEVDENSRYKYRIVSRNGVKLKADPYAFFSETQNKTASVLWHDKGFSWSDEEFLKRRSRIYGEKERCSFPLNIYEVHLGSWKALKAREGEQPCNNYGYRAIADSLSVYLSIMGYTHVELLPIAEHPYDGSWGYQICGYFAPSSRFGTPHDFKYFVDKMHSRGIGVILDWVPAHFPKDEQGLFEYDGEPLYEYHGADRMEQASWGTRCFDVGRNEVQSFLVSNAMYWFREFHIDGLRVDAVASMLYLDYDRRPGEWIPNIYGENKNLEAVAFFKKLNSVVRGEFSDVLMIAEESSDWNMITKPVSDGGLGFDFKWDMGFSHDSFRYFSTDPIFRKHHHGDLTFSMMYAFNERYILPVSHDEVVHGKKSLLNKMWGDYREKFAGFRLFLLWMMAHPGKKMLFMGCEYGPFREWDHSDQLEWFMLKYETHSSLQRYTAALNRFYLNRRELWENDISWEGFEWIHSDLKEENVIAFKRIGRGGEFLVFILNFSAVDRPVSIPSTASSYDVLFETSPSGIGTLIPNKETLTVNIGPLSGVCLRPAEADTNISKEKRKCIREKNA